MKKKIVLSVIMLALLAAAVVSVIVVKNHTVTNSKPQSYSSLDEANEASDFSLDGSDRLCGYPATNYEASSDTVKIIYADAGFISKTLGESDNSTGNRSYTETSERDIDGKTVTFSGNEGNVYLAVWNENGFSYTVSVTEGVEADEMSEYVKVTR